MRLDIYNLQCGLVGNPMGGKVSKLAYRIDDRVNARRKRFLRVGFSKDSIDLLRKIILARFAKNSLKAPPR
jgi:hypothetical protein